MSGNVEIIIDGLQHQRADVVFYWHLKDLLENTLQKKNIQAVWHPLGFIILTLHDWHDDRRLRLHIWPKSVRRFNDNRNWIHSHEYSITSLVIMGNIINNKYDCLVSDLDESVPVYHVEHYGQNSDLTQIDKHYKVTLEQRENITEGRIYQVPIGSFHSSETSIKCETCTIVLNSGKKKESPEVLGTQKKSKKNYPYKREKCDSELIKMLLRRVVLRIESAIVLSDMKLRETQ